MIDWEWAMWDQRGRFWSKVRKDGPTVRPDLGPCWLFVGRLDKDGYGTFMVTSPELPAKPRQRLMRAHRLAFFLQTGRLLSADEVLLHVCDTRACCNPSHLRVGTHADNVHDTMRKGRAKFSLPAPMLGSENPAAKLTAAAARLILKRRTKGQSTSAIAREFGVSTAIVKRVVAGSIWAHATGVQRSAPPRLGRRRLVQLNGETRPLGSWCEMLGISFDLVIRRVWGGWSTEKALTTKPRYSVSRKRKLAAEAA